MTDHEYHELADALMLTIEEQIDDCDVDLDYESQSGILEIIFPDKVRINIEYIRDWTLLGDIRYIIQTVFH